MGRKLITSESVTEGHPDKICDQISDAILDAILERDPYGRVACEALVTRGLVFVAGEITTECYVEIPDIIRTTIRDAGYTDPNSGFDSDSCAVVTSIQEQSGDIALGVNIGGAGDQGMMYGFAINETKELMPLPIMLAHQLVKRLSETREAKMIPYIWPDGKAQVTMMYEDDKPLKVDTVIVSTQHHPDAKLENLREEVIERVIKPVIPGKYIDNETKYLINPTGRFVIGGPQGDSGVTGRKIMVDTYGGFGHHGGGCFSGKDPSKVDRSASYMARYVAKNLVAAELADKLELQIAYAIGVPDPIAITVDSFSTGKIKDEQIVHIVKEIFDFTPAGMIDKLSLRRPIYKKTAVYGHFGREDEGFPWEACDMVEIIKRMV